MYIYTIILYCIILYCILSPSVTSISIYIYTIILYCIILYCIKYDISERSNFSIFILFYFLIKRPRFSSYLIYDLDL